MEYRKVLVLMDFSRHAEDAARAAADFAGKYGSAVTLLYVIPDVTSLSFVLSDTEYHNVDRKLEKRAGEQFAALFETVPELAELQVETKIRRGVPYISCLYEIEKGNYDIVFAGSHGESNLKKVLMGSTVEKVMRRSPINVFVARR